MPKKKNKNKKENRPPTAKMTSCAFISDDPYTSVSFNKEETVRTIVSCLMCCADEFNLTYQTEFEAFCTVAALKLLERYEGKMTVNIYSPIALPSEMTENQLIAERLIKEYCAANQTANQLYATCSATRELIHARSLIIVGEGQVGTKLF